MADITRRWKREWEALNPILRDGEPGVEKDSSRLKIGDGQTPWVDLTFVAGSGSSGGSFVLPDRLSESSLKSTFQQSWRPNTDYAKDETVISPAGQVVSAKAAFTSGATYSAANWTVKSFVLPQYLSETSLGETYGAKSDVTTNANAIAKKTYPSLRKKPLPPPLRPVSGMVAALLRGQRSVVMQVVGDSTTVAPTRWFGALGKRIGQACPGYTVLHRSYSAGQDQYNQPTVLQAGTLNGGGTRGLRYNSGNPFSYQMPSAITGDIDVRAKVALDNWASGANQVILAQWSSATTRVFSFQVNSSGTLGIGLSSDGSAALTTVSSTVAPTVAAGATLWIRATVDVDNGSSQRVITFYTSTDGETWTQLGNVVTVSGAITLFNGNPIVTLGSRFTSSLYTDRAVGTFYWVEVRNGINGPSLVPPLIDSWDFVIGTDETGFAWVGAPVILMVNGGIGGQKISYFSDPARAAVLHQDHGADVFLLNDGHNEGQLSRQSLINALSTYITMVKGYIPNRPIVLVGQNPVNPAFFSANALSKRYARYQTMATWAASQQGIYYVDSYYYFTDLAAQLSSADGLHPVGTDVVTDGTAGDQVWADAIFQQLFGGSLGAFGSFENPFLPIS